MHCRAAPAARGAETHKAEPQHTGRSIMHHMPHMSTCCEVMQRACGGAARRAGPAPRRLGVAAAARQAAGAQDALRLRSQARARACGEQNPPPNMPPGWGRGRGTSAVAARARTSAPATCTTRKRREEMRREARVYRAIVTNLCECEKQRARPESCAPERGEMLTMPPEHLQRRGSVSAGPRTRLGAGEARSKVEIKGFVCSPPPQKACISSLRAPRVQIGGSRPADRSKRVKTGPS